MPVTPTYPGVYIEELPSTSHTITAAPTSIAAFVGYTHPLKTKWPGAAIQLFSFADYQANFGGFFDSTWRPGDYVGRAVFQFFQNGGSTAYVVGVTDPGYDPATLNFGSPPVTLIAREPVGPIPDSSTSGIPMTLTISNVSTSATNGTSGDTADIVIAYGNQVETYRKVHIGDLYDKPATDTSPAQPGRLANSALVTVAPLPATSPPTSPPTSYLTSPPSAGAPMYFRYESQPTPTYGIQPILDVLKDNESLDKVPIFNLLVIPGVTDQPVLAEGVAYAERKRAFYIMDSPFNWDVDTQQGVSTTASKESPLDGLDALPVPVSANAAIYYPWLKTTDPITNSPISPVTKEQSVSPPSGFVAGIFAREDAARGVWKSPAGLETTLNGTLSVVDSGVMTDAQQGGLNQKGINCLRHFPSLPPVVYGARTLAYRNPSLKDQWGYVAVRRMALFLEQSLYANLTWAVFEPNDTPLWNALTQEVSAFMLGLFRQGAFAGTTPRQAFLVQCDATTTTPADVANGIVNVLVGFAPLRPAEFVIVQIAQLAGQGAT